ncbi:MAG: hypothetical protein ACRD1T_06435 [Acidimicrobiia bacterium]
MTTGSGPGSGNAVPDRVERLSDRAVHHEVLVGEARSASALASGHLQGEIESIRAPRPILSIKGFERSAPEP